MNELHIYRYFLIRHNLTAHRRGIIKRNMRTISIKIVYKTSHTQWCVEGRPRPKGPTSTVKVTYFYQFLSVKFLKFAGKDFLSLRNTSSKKDLLSLGSESRRTKSMWITMILRESFYLHVKLTVKFSIVKIRNPCIEMRAFFADWLKLKYQEKSVDLSDEDCRTVNVLNLSVEKISSSVDPISGQRFEDQQFWQSCSFNHHCSIKCVPLVYRHFRYEWSNNARWRLLFQNAMTISAKIVQRC